MAAILEPVGLVTSLTEVADRQSLWSQTANALKVNLEISRWATLLLSILGALLATVAGQLDAPQPRLYVALAGAVVFAVMSFFFARLLNGANVVNWVRARAASEALKRTAFEYAAGASPFNELDTRDARLNEERNRIEQDVDDLAAFQVTGHKLGSSPRANLTRGQYVRKRVRQQIDVYYLPKAKAHRRVASALRSIEFLLSLLATIIAAVVGILGKEVLGFKFDFVAMTSVLTTVAGAVLAHIEAARYDFLVATYRTTARRLANELAEVDDVDAMTIEGWSAFVNRCEAIICEENSSWMSKWSKFSWSDVD